MWSACKTRGPTEYFGRSLINSISSSVKFMWSDKRKFSGRVSASLMSSPFSSRTANGISAKSSARLPALMWIPSAAFLNSSPASVESPFLMSAPALLSSGFKERIVSPAKRRVFVGSPPFKIKKHSTSRRKSWLRKNELLMQRQRISRRPAPPGISFKEKVGSVVALWPTTANLSIIEYLYWSGFVFKVCSLFGCFVCVDAGFGGWFKIHALLFRTEMRENRLMNVGMNRLAQIQHRCSPGLHLCFAVRRNQSKSVFFLFMIHHYYKAPLSLNTQTPQSNPV